MKNIITKHLLQLGKAKANRKKLRKQYCQTCK